MRNNMPTAIVTSGPTREKIDPVRFISNFSSGKQGHAIAAALHEAGFDVTLVSGPVNIPAPFGVKVINVETAEEMRDACVALLPVDVAVCAAAVCDFRPVDVAAQKIKKQDGVSKVIIELIQNPDILKTIGTHKLRPKVVVGFAAETEKLISNAKDKLQKKNCDIIVANDVGSGEIFGSDATCVSIISSDGVEPLGALAKSEFARILVSRISTLL
jgi:phosphopantothenoylcysteine decarboxylase / phosphopantothenate---cysteine ligase